MNLGKALSLAKQIADKANGGLNQAKLTELLEALVKNHPAIAKPFAQHIDEFITQNATKLSQLPDAAGWSIYEIRRAIAALILKGKVAYVLANRFAKFQENVAKEMPADQIVPLSNWIELIGLKWPRTEERKAREAINVEEKKIQEPVNVVPEKFESLDSFKKTYKEIKKLGQGSFGEVKLYEDINTQKRYVGKEVKEFVEFEEEFKILKQIKPECSPYLLCVEFVVNIKVDPNQPIWRWILMYDYIPDSMDLETYLQTNGLNNHIARELLKGLVKLHKLGIVHRDIKPANILIETKNQAIHYLDYGISCFINNRQCLSTKSGTYMFAAPEQILLGSSTAKSDVWSLGMIFAETWGKRADVEFIAFRMMRGTEPTQLQLNNLAASLPEPKKQLLTAMLQVNPQKRTSAQDALDLFNRLFAE